MKKIWDIVPLPLSEGIPLNKRITHDELNRLLVTPHTPQRWHFHRWIFWKFYQKRHRVCRICFKKQMEQSGVFHLPGNGWVSDSIFANNR